MNSIRNILQVLPMIIALSCSILANDFSASAILDSMMSTMQSVSSIGRIEQEIISSGNIKRVFTYEHFSDNYGENVLIRYIKPRKVKNNAFLIKNSGDDIWIYFPRTRRVRKLASHAKKQKAQGSDFSYEDFSRSKKWETDYHVKKVDSGERTTYLLTFTRKKDSDASYESQKIFVDKKNYYPHRIQYFQDGGHLKTLRFSDVINIQGYPTAKSMIMENHIEKSKTQMRILEMDYNVKFEKDFFTERNLKK